MGQSKNDRLLRWLFNNNNSRLIIIKRRGSETCPLKEKTICERSVSLLLFSLHLHGGLGLLLPSESLPSND